MIAAVRSRGAKFLALLVASTMLSASLSGQPAQAAPVFASSTFFATANASTTDPGGCTVAQTKSAPVLDEPVIENGPAFRASASTTGTVTRNGDNGDVVAFDSRLTEPRPSRQRVGTRRSSSSPWPEPWRRRRPNRSPVAS